MALTRSRSSTAAALPVPAAMASPAAHVSSVSVPIRFQCPLCLDVLRRPIQLPCCHRFLCMECFERGLELTSVNCGFCRRRVVGFARSKKFKVDEGMWTAVKKQCPFLKDGNEEDNEPTVEFYDEDAPPLHGGGEDHPTADEGEVKAFYERQLREHQSQVEAAEQRAMEQTIEFLQNDPEFNASLHSSVSPTSSSSSSPKARKKHGVKPKPKFTTRSASHRVVTRSLSQTEDLKQPKLDNFFGSNRSTSSHSNGHSLRSHSDAIGLSPPRTRSHFKLDESHKKYLLRSASASPTKNTRRRNNGKARKGLLQLTLDSTLSPIALHTRSQDLKRANSCDSEQSKMLTRQGRRRSSWRCAECTFTNTCFDNRCSMCYSLPPPEAYSPLDSE